MSTYQHKETKIEFDAARAKFTATVNGKRLTSGSLDAIKKQIDAAMVSAFEPFSAIDFGNSKIRSFRVVAIAKGTHRRYGATPFTFECEGLNHWEGNQTQVIIDTPENRKIVAAYLKRSKEIKAEEDRLEKEMDALRDSLPYITATDYAIGKYKA